jgi:hypothetical protein
MDIEIIADNSEEVLDAIRRAMPRALEKCGREVRKKNRGEEK